MKESKINLVLKYIGTDSHRYHLESFGLPIPLVLAAFTVLDDIDTTFLCELQDIDSGKFSIALTFVCEAIAIAVRTLLSDEELLTGIVLMAESGLIDIATSIVSGLHIAEHDRSFAICAN